MPWNKSVLVADSVGNIDYTVLTAGSGVTLTTGDGILTVAATGGPGGQAFPVGSVFLAVVSTNPATLLGYGTWSAFGAGRVLIGLDAADPDFDLVEETGGAKTVAAAGTVSQPTFAGNALAGHTHGAGTLATSAHVGSAVADHASHTHAVTSNVAVADHVSHTHDYSTVIAHTHTLNDVAKATTGGATTHFQTLTNTTDTSSTASGAATDSTGSASGTTTGPSAALSHSVTNNAVTSGGPSAILTHAVTQPSDHTLSGASASVSAGTPSGTVSQPTLTGSPTSVVQPYIVVYMWKRTA